MKNFYLIKLALLLTCCLCSLPALAANRVALVIGNATYLEGPLKNPVNDARAMVQKLTVLGFKVQSVENMTHRQIGRTMAAFGKSLHAGDEVVVFYAGHGLQVKGVNYFPAVDADIQSEEDVPQNSLNLNALLESMKEAKVGVKLLFLDACRNNPFLRRFRGGERGLARIGAVPSGTLIHFATKPGGVADDGGTAANGLYTSALLRHLDAPGVSVETMVKRVAAMVEQDSRGKQEPWSEGSIKGEFYFKAGAVPPVQTDAAQGYKSAWEAAQRANTVAGYDAFLEEYPQGQFAAAARVARKTVAGALPATAQAVPTAAVPAMQAGQVVKDCDVCPEMVLIPGGSFMMGDAGSQHDDEKPVHRVTVGSFMLGKTEVTQAQWQAIMGNNPSGFKDCGGNCPVDSVSWDDAQAFIKKLNARTGKTYRLPSEAEWEYAARAGSTTAYPWGQQASHEYANYGTDECCDGLASGRDQWVSTAPVASFPANLFGLFDMHGNVREWVEDCFHIDYNGAPADGSYWNVGCQKNEYRVLRGGSWSNYPDDLRSAYRNLNDPTVRGDRVGFRIARTPP
jgi:formylglycine-generating enzyme required for sulfatase activity